jgi:hypothetical protein
MTEPDTTPFAFELESKRVCDQVAGWMQAVKTGNSEADACIATDVIEAVMEIWRSTYADEKKGRTKKSA